MRLKLTPPPLEPPTVTFGSDGQAKKIHLTAKGHGMAEIMCSARELAFAGNEGKQRTWNAPRIEANWYAPQKWNDAPDFGGAATRGRIGCLV
jgi:hypothetical protein